uniref:Kit ligand n=1 Tax=Fundulus heteroclitus TaxID=8078 RepID=A0A3Q2TK30_FUNHE
LRKRIIISTTCVLLGLFSSLRLCSGKFGTPITDDVSKLSILKQNIPSDYEIPVSYIPKEAGTCWVVLNIYPLEQSLRKLASMFGAMSSNKDNIIVFIAMLKSLRGSEEETAMQVFQCHYQEKSLLSGLYFDYIQDLLNAATQGTSSFSCKPCFKTPKGEKKSDNNYRFNVVQEVCNYSLLAEGQEERYSWLKRSPLLLVIIPFTACVVLIVWQVRRLLNFTPYLKVSHNPLRDMTYKYSHNNCCQIWAYSLPKMNYKMLALFSLDIFVGAVLIRHVTQRIVGFLKPP